MSTQTAERPPRAGDRPNAAERHTSAPAAAGEPKPAARSFPVRRLIALALLTAGVGVGWWRYDHTAAHAPAELVLQGNIDVRQVNLSFKVAGRVQTLLADEGNPVKAGQVIARLDEVYFRDDLRLARAQRDQAAANHERLKNGSRPEEVEQAKALEAQAEAALKRAQQDFDRNDASIRSGVGSRQDYDLALATLRDAQARLKSAAAARRLAEIGPRAEDVAAARAQLAAAEAQVVAADRRLTDAALVAPHDGVVLTRAREEGAVVNAGETVFSLTLSSPVWVRTYVGEPDLGTVEPGMPVAVRTDAGRSYTGAVGFVSPTAEFTPKSVETRELRTDLVYRLRVVVADPDGGLRQGMPVTVAVKLPGPRTRPWKERLSEALWLDRLGLTDGGKP